MRDSDAMTKANSKYIPGSKDAQRFQGWGTALKPAHEPICVARKPMIGTVARNVLKHKVGALNIDECRVPTRDKFGDGATAGGKNAVYGNFGEYKRSPHKPGHSSDRWPSNFIHDGGPDVLRAFPNGKESPARFFYCPKASKQEKGRGNEHPTVKPIALMRYLIRLVTPEGGLVLDPFMGSGTTCVAAKLEKARSIGIELERKSADTAVRRVESTSVPKSNIKSKGLIKKRKS